MYLVKAITLNQYSTFIGYDMRVREQDLVKSSCPLQGALEIRCFLMLHIH